MKGIRLRFRLRRRLANSRGVQSVELDELSTDHTKSQSSAFPVKPTAPRDPSP